MLWLRIQEQCCSLYVSVFQPVVVRSSRKRPQRRWLLVVTRGCTVRPSRSGGVAAEERRRHQREDSASSLHAASSGVQVRQGRGASCLVLSCLVLSCLVLSCLVLSCLVLSCLVLSCLVLSCLVLSCLVFSTDLISRC